MYLREEYQQHQHFWLDSYKECCEENRKLVMENEQLKIEKLVLENKILIANLHKKKSYRSFLRKQHNIVRRIYDYLFV